MRVEDPGASSLIGDGAAFGLINAGDGIASVASWRPRPPTDFVGLSGATAPVSRRRCFSASTQARLT
jgi:hypothetical protein